MSKNTLYFNTVEEARQYFPDGVPSNVIAIVGDGSQVLVSSDNAAANANQQYYNADLTNDEIVNTMVQTSYSEGEAAGYTAGETAGYNTGYTAGEAAGYDTGYAAGQAAAAGITANDFLGQIVNNTITAGYSSLFMDAAVPGDPSILTDAYQAASDGLGVVYKASGDTLSTLPLYNPYDEEVGSQSELVYNDGTDEHSYYDWMASAPISLQVGDMLGFVVGSEYNPLWVGPFDGGEPFVCETAGNYTVLLYSWTDDETGTINWDFLIVPSTQLSGDYSNITDLNEMTMPISSGE